MHSSKVQSLIFRVKCYRGECFSSPMERLWQSLRYESSDVNGQSWMMIVSCESSGVTIFDRVNPGGVWWPCILSQTNIKLQLLASALNAIKHLPTKSPQLSNQQRSRKYAHPIFITSTTLIFWTNPFFGFLTHTSLGFWLSFSLSSPESLHPGAVLPWRSRLRCSRPTCGSCREKPWTYLNCES